jgi:hypothetical protein
VLDREAKPARHAKDRGYDWKIHIDQTPSDSGKFRDWRPQAVPRIGYADWLTGPTAVHAAAIPYAPNAFSGAERDWT